MNLAEIDRFRSGVGADHHAESAVHWYRQASDQGHTRAQYNLAISHLRGFNTGLQPGFVEKIELELRSFSLSAV